MRLRNELDAEAYFADSWRGTKVEQHPYEKGYLERFGVAMARWQFMWDRFRDVIGEEEKTRLLALAAKAREENARGNVSGALLAASARFVLKYRLEGLPEEYIRWCLAVFYNGVEEDICEWHMFGGKRLYKWGKVGEYSSIKEAPPATLGVREGHKGVHRNEEFKERAKRKPEEYD